MTVLIVRVKLMTNSDKKVYAEQKVQSQKQVKALQKRMSLRDCTLDKKGQTKTKTLVPERSHYNKKLSIEQNIE